MPKRAAGALLRRYPSRYAAQGEAPSPPQTGTPQRVLLNGPAALAQRGPRGCKLWGWAACWLAVPRSLPEKLQWLSLLLGASPREEALFWGSPRGYPPAAPLVSAGFHTGCTEKGEKGEENASQRTLHTQSLCRQKRPQHSHGGK